MTALTLSDPVPMADAPELTADKLGREWGKQIDWSAVKRRGERFRGRGDEKPNMAETSPLLSLAEINAEHGPDTAYAPQWKLATFRIPLGIRWSEYEKLRDQRAALWVNAEAKDGWDLCTDSRITARPGPYPAHDLDTGVPLLGEREVILAARFRQRAPQLFTWELPRDWFERPAE